MPEEDVRQLLAMGVDAILGQDATPDEIVAIVREHTKPPNPPLEGEVEHAR
jgi:DNA-binding NarL/FixJ family response regulator